MSFFRWQTRTRKSSASLESRKLERDFPTKSYKKLLLSCLITSIVLLLVMFAPASYWALGIFLGLMGDGVPLYTIVVGVLSLLVILVPASTIWISLRGLKRQDDRARQRCARIAVGGVIGSIVLNVCLHSMILS